MDRAAGRNDRRRQFRLRRHRAVGQVRRGRQRARGSRPAGDRSSTPAARGKCRAAAVIRARPALQSADPEPRGAANFQPSSHPEALVVDLSQYLPILIFLAIALGLSALFVFLPMGVARLTGTHNPNAEKLSEYECGFPAFEDPRSQFDVRFYLIAILFIVSDLEAAFLFPWAVSLDLTGWPGWITMMVFLFELGVGLAYAWKKGALEWE